MKYTKEELGGMSDLQLNKEVAMYCFNYNDEIVLTQSPRMDSSVWVECGGVLQNANYDPCSEWGDCGALIDSIWAQLMKSNGTYCAWDYLMEDIGCSKLRAAVIIYILTKQGDL